MEKCSRFKAGIPLRCVIAAFIVASSVLNAQESFRSFPPASAESVKVSSLSFERLLNTFVWNGLTNFIRDESDSRIHLSQNVRSRLIRTEATSVQDEYTGSVDVGIRATEKWSVRVREASSVVSDSRSLDLGKLAHHQLMAGGEYAIAPGVAGEALGGYELNSQENERDAGFVYSAATSAEKVQLEEFQTAFRAQWIQSMLGRRRPHSGGLSLLLHRDFGPEAADSLVVRFDTQRREFYTFADSALHGLYGISSNIFRRDAQVIDISNYLQYRISPQAQLSLSGGVLNRLIDREYRYKDYSDPSSIVLNTRIQEMQIYGTAAMTWTLADWFNANIGLSYFEREERHSVGEESGIPAGTLQNQQSSARRLESASRRTVLSSLFNSVVSDDDNLRLVSSVSLLQYDTPDSLNTDDRDELLVTAGMEEVHRFSSYLVMTLSADVTLSHLVYLHRDQSANNNWNRILLLSPKVEYTPTRWFRTVNRAEVLANYTVYDFEEQVASVRSFSFRQALWMDSTVIRLNERIELEFTGSLRLFERGILKWKEFRERPENYFVEKTLWPQLVFVTQEGLRIGIGYRFFSQDQYHYQGADRIYDRGIQTSGPTALVEWNGNGYQRVSVEGWRESQSADGRTTAIIPNLSVKVNFLL